MGHLELPYGSRARKTDAGYQAPKRVQPREVHFKETSGFHTAPVAYRQTARIGGLSYPSKMRLAEAAEACYRTPG